MIKSHALYIFVLLLISTVSFSQSDVEGSEDHPALTRYPDSYIASYEQVKFQEYDLALGPITGYRQIEKRKKISGPLTRITYLIDKNVNEVSINEVYFDYLESFRDEKIRIMANGVFGSRNVKKDVGGGTWIEVALGPNGFSQDSKANLLFAGTSSSGGTFSIIGEIQDDKKIVYVALYGERHSDDLVVCHLDVIEEKAADIGYVKANADYISDEMTAKGKVTIYGIRFDFNSSTIKEESKEVILEIAKYLKENPEVRCYVVGHTDMVGSLSFNLKLSKERAISLRSELINSYGINGERLIADGVAFLSPVATNDTEEGRKMNRRTELIRIRER